MSSPAIKPLFLPLKTEYFRAFEARDKEVEYRRYGPRWNETICSVGRAVTLSHGYSGARLRAKITRFEVKRMSTDTYGKDQLIACIHLAIF